MRLISSGGFLPLLGLLGSLVMADDTTCGCSRAAVTGQVADDTANQGAFNAAFSRNRSRCCDRPHANNGEYGQTTKNGLHDYLHTLCPCCQLSAP